MKLGMTLQEMAAELERQKNNKRDFIAPTDQLKVGLDYGDPKWTSEGLRLEVNGHGKFPLSETGHNQLAQRVGIPEKYYERMRSEAPELLAANVNTWFQKQPEKRLVRTLDGKARAFLSSRYRPLDNFDLADVALQTLLKLPGLRIESTALTESRLYIKAVTDRITAEVQKGDVVQAGIVITNSEIGLGSIKVEPLVYRLICLNGMIVNDAAMRRKHVGRHIESDGELAEELYLDETRRADDKAFWMKVRDVISGSFKQDIFNLSVQKMRDATHSPEIRKPSKAIEVVTARFSLRDEESEGLMAHLIKGGDLTKYGLLNAFTRVSQDVPSYDRATDLERIGGEILELPKSDWEVISQAA